MIEVKNLTKCYGKHLAVDNLSFTVQEGQIYGFLGPNGAGKSTTMNIMTGYLGATKGEVPRFWSTCSNAPLADLYISGKDMTMAAMTVAAQENAILMLK